MIPMTDYTPFRISRQELSYHRKAFLERCQLQGRRCIVQEPSTRNLPLNTTTDYYEYNGPKYEYYVMIQSDPPKTILEKFGFDKESKDSVPIIIDCPCYRKKTEDEYNVLQSDAPEDNTNDNFSFSLGTITGVNNMSDGYPRDDIIDFRISEGCIIHILMYDGSRSDDYSWQKFTVEKVISKEDGVCDTANLVPYREQSTGTPEETTGDSGARFILQDDD